MTRLVPNRFLFDFEFPLRYRAEAPPIDGRLTGWTDADRLPRLGAVDGRRDFADWWACWNETGLFVAVQVAGRTRPLQCKPSKFWKGDNVRLCVDMRDTRDVRRATRFCRQFFLLPTGGGPSRRDPVAGTNTIQRAREPAPPIDPDMIRVASTVSHDGYCLEAHLPVDVLTGFDPTEHSRIGFYLLVEDRDLGQQYLTVGDDLSWHVDPSTWPTAVLTRAVSG